MRQILLVDDEKHLRETVAELLETAGYSVKTAINGAEALDMLVTYRPDAILCDVMMPKLNGFQLLAVLTKTFGEEQVPPFIFLSAKSEMSDFRDGMNLGADDYLVKPFSTAELLNVLESKIEKRGRLKQAVETKERSRMASILHDEVQPSLVACKISLSNHVRKLKEDEVSDAESIEQLVALLTDAINDTRSLSHEITDQETLDTRLSYKLEALAKGAHCKIDYKLNIQKEPNKAVADAVFKGVNEGVCNALKHSKTNEILVSVQAINGSVVSTITDDGIGFSSDKLGHGLLSLRNRIEQLEGDLKIDSKKGKGTEVVISLPLFG